MQPAGGVGRALELGHLVAQPVRRTVTSADELRVDALPREVVELTVDRLAEDLHEGR